jgi:hypothetical protein
MIWCAIIVPSVEVEKSPASEIDAVPFPGPKREEHCHTLKALLMVPTTLVPTAVSIVVSEA